MSIHYGGRGPGHIARVQGGGAIAQIATRSALPVAINAGATQIFSRTTHVARDNVTSLQCVFSNWYINNNNETATGGTATIYAAVEYPIGVTRTRILFSGANAGSIPSGSDLVSDALNITIPAGSTFAIKTLLENSSGVVYSSFRDGSVDGFQTGTGALTDQTTSSTNPPTSTNAYAPSAIIAFTRKKSIFIAGDSRAAGFGDSANLSYKGEIEGSVNSLPFISSARSAATIPTADWTRRLALSRYCTHVVSNFGINDVNAGTSSATMISRIQTFASWFSQPFYQLTISPRTTSTDGWVTTVNQTADGANNTRRIELNTAIRAGLTNVEGYFDVADAMESARDSGIWKANYCGDGTHQNATGYAAVLSSGAINPAVFT